MIAKSLTTAVLAVGLISSAQTYLAKPLFLLVSSTFSTMLPKYILPLVAALVVTTEILPAQAPATPSSDRIRAALLDPAAKGVFIIAHRGDWREYPENSIPAIESCIREGIPIIEVDVAKTKDGHVVLMHDKTVDRTTTGKGRVEDMTLEEIKKLRLKSGIGQPTPWEVPTLEEALMAGKGKVLFDLDRKGADVPDMLPILRRTGTASQIIFVTSKADRERAPFTGEDAETYKDLLFVPVANLGRENGMNLARDYLKASPSVLILSYKQWNPEYEAIYRECSKSGVRVWNALLWGGIVGDHSDDGALTEPDAVYGWLMDKGATVIMTDRPFTLKRYLAAKGALPNLN